MNNKITFIDYIDSSDKNVLFLHPQSLGSYNIISFIISLDQMFGKSVIIITNCKDKINKSLPGALPDNHYIKYHGVLDYVNNHYVNNQYILIDDYQLYIDNKLNDILKDLKILVLTRGNVKIVDTWNIIYLGLYEHGPILKHHSILTTKKNIYKDISNKILLNINKKHLITELNTKKDNFPHLTNFNNISYTDDSASLNNPTNIETLHITKIKLEYYLKILNIIYKRNVISDNIDKIEVIFYLDPDNKNDVDDYDVIVNYIEEYQKNYLTLLNTAKIIYYNDTTGLYLELGQI